MMSASLTDQGTLIISGTEGADVVTVAKPKGQIVVTENGVQQTFDASAVKRIVASLGGGDDSFAMHTRSAKRLTVNGGAGNDNIAGGAGADKLSGEDGNDAINGGHGSDTLDGGKGEDVINAVDFRLALLSDPPQFSNPFSDTIIAQGDGASDRISHDPTDTLHVDGKDQVAQDDGTRTRNIGDITSVTVDPVIA